MIEFQIGILVRNVEERMDSIWIQLAGIVAFMSGLISVKAIRIPGGVYCYGDVWAQPTRQRLRAGIIRSRPRHAGNNCLRCPRPSTSGSRIFARGTRILLSSSLHFVGRKTTEEGPHTQLGKGSLVAPYGVAFLPDGTGLVVTDQVGRRRQPLRLSGPVLQNGSAHRRRCRPRIRLANARQRRRVACDAKGTSRRHV